MGTSSSYRDLDYQRRTKGARIRALAPDRGREVASIHGEVPLHVGVCSGFIVDGNACLGLSAKRDHDAG